MAYTFAFDNTDQTLYHAPEFKARLDSTVADARSVVYVGWRPQDSTMRFFDWIQSLEGSRLVVMLEAWKPNYEVFSRSGVFKAHGDVKDLLTLLPHWARDCLVWQDGPEHLEKDEGEALLGIFKNSGFNSIVLASPNGRYEQGKLDGNPYEEHKNHWTIESYERLNFECQTYSAGLIALWTRPKE